MSTETQKVDVLAVMDNAILGMARHPNLQIRMHDLESARGAVTELIAVATRSVPFLRDEADKYEDDGSNEPLETLRDLEAALARVGGAA